MWITYTFESRAMQGEETVTILIPHPHQVQGGQYTLEDLYEKRRLLPALIAMGDEGTENNWWMRMSFAEGDVHRDICAVICVRGMSLNEKSIQFLRDELPVLLCAQFPIDPQKLVWMGWKRTEAFAEALEGGPYEVYRAECDDAAQAIADAIRLTAGKGR